MYKILIADDEGIVRESLQFIIEKNFPDKCVLVFARNGRQAIEMAEQERPDITFLDIQMPGLTGLRALEEMRTMNPRMKTLILTAYDNVEYVKEALRLGAVNYLTKPINRDEITKQLAELFALVDKEKRKRSEELLIREKMDAAVSILENGFILNMIMQSSDPGESEQYRMLLSIEENYGSFLVIEWGESGAGNLLENPIGSGVRGYSYASKMAELIKVYFRAFVSSVIQNRIVVYIPCEEESLSYSKRVLMIDQARKLRHALEDMVGADFRIGIGTVRSYENARLSYQSAMQALRHGSQGINHSDDMIDSSHEEGALDWIEQQLIHSISAGMEQDARREALEYVSRLRESGETREEENVRLAAVYLYIRKLMIREGILEADKTEPAETAALLHSEDEESLKEHFASIMGELANAVVLDDPLSRNRIRKAAQYMRDNFSKDLSQEEVAAQVGISPYYFSRLFKEEIGQNYTDYLTELRIEQARQMLRNPRYSIKEICVESGYANPNYFSRIFKRTTGMTPTEYRESQGSST